MNINIKQSNYRKALISMTMPEFPPQYHRPDLHHALIDLLDSIALEEIALSHLLNAEAEKIQHFICHISSCTPPMF